MAGHGGYRPGAGAKKRKGLSADALETLGAVVYGLGDSLVLAGRQIVPEANDAEAMRLAVAGISHDNILAGNGMRVVELFAAGLERLTRAQPGGEDKPKSLILEAMQALPGAQMGTEQAQDEPEPEATPALARLPGLGAGDSKSSVPALERSIRPDQPVFAAQGSLFPAFGPGAGGASAHPAGRPPTPPAAPALVGLTLRAENLEKIVPGTEKAPAGGGA
jgi:hypothetical protein